jgi:voltage-gated potassium channel
VESSPFSCHDDRGRSDQLECDHWTVLDLLVWILGISSCAARDPQYAKNRNIACTAMKQESPLLKLRHKAHHLFHSEGEEHGHWSAEHWTKIIIASVIMLSMLSIILETEPELESNYHAYFWAFEIFTVAVFSIEYLLRLWCIVEDKDKRYSHWFWGRLRYAVSPLALVDLVAVMPFYLPALITVDLRFLRMLRLIRLVRVMKLGHYSKSLTHVSKVIKAKKSELAASLFILAVLLLFSSTIMYYVEHEKQPEAFRSIPTAFWWGIETLTTVGYGDVAPMTALGKFCAAIIAILGIGLFGLPTAIIATGFLEEVQHKRQKQLCDDCGKLLKEVSLEEEHIAI